MNKQMQHKNKIKINIGAYSTCLIILILSMGYALLNETFTIEATGVIDVPPGEKLWQVILANEEPTLNIAAKYLNSPKHQDIKFALEAKLKE